LSTYGKTYNVAKRNRYSPAAYLEGAEKLSFATFTKLAHQNPRANRHIKAEIYASREAELLTG